METMQDFMDQIDASTQNLKRGELVEGSVIQTGEDHVIADINYAQDGVIFDDELVKAPTEYQKEDKVQLVVIGFNKDGQVILSEKKAQRQYGEAVLREAEEKGTYVEATLKSIAKGGYRVDVFGIQGYLPFSLYQHNYLEDPESHLGEKTLLAIEKSDNRGYVFTRMPIAEKIRQESRDKFYAAHGVGDKVEGVQKAFNRGGVVVDVEGVRGFIPNSEVSYSRSVKPQDIIEKGATLNLIIRELNKEKDQLILSYKETKQDPWQDIDANLEIGDVFELKPEGQNQNFYFYELIEGVQGSLFKKQVPQEVIDEGADHNVVVVAIDKRRRRVELDYFFEIEERIEEESDNSAGGNTLGDLFGKELGKLKFD